VAVETASKCPPKEKLNLHAGPLHFLELVLLKSFWPALEFFQKMTAPSY